MPSALTPSVHPSSITILAVDDDHAILDLLGSVLRSAGYRVLIAEGGWSAIRTYEACAEPVHLLVTGRDHAGSHRPGSSRAASGAATRLTSVVHFRMSRRGYVATVRDAKRLRALAQAIHNREPAARSFRSSQAGIRGLTSGETSGRGSLRSTNKLHFHLFRDNPRFKAKVKQFLRRPRDYFAGIHCVVIHVHAHKLIGQARFHIARELHRVVQRFGMIIQSVLKSLSRITRQHSRS